MFYADTAINFNAPALKLAHTFFGPEHLLFGTDTPYDNACGDRDIRETIRSIEDLELSEVDKRKIYEDNARSLARLAV
jgi:predicted TIM-barrel fold metal-dependent hydrolase